MTFSRRTVLAISAAATAAPALAAKADPIAAMTVINALGGLIDPNHDQPAHPVMTPRILADARASGMTAAVNCTFRLWWRAPMSRSRARSPTSPNGTA